MIGNRKRSRLARQEERLAYLMLVPTIIILLVVALYPLGNVFYTSFTDKTFASSKEVSFIGFDNYKDLLSMKIYELPPLTDESTGAQRYDESTGEALYARPLDILPRTPVRYKELKVFNIFGNRYVLGATNPDFVASIGNTIVFTVLSVFLELVFGMGVAMIVNTKFKGQGAMRTIMLVPWAVITVVSARMWEFMFKATRVGFFNMLFEKIGIGSGHISFLTDSTYQLTAMVMVDVWKTTPYMALLILAGLQLIPGSLYEAARIDGAGAFRQFTSITLPLLKPTIAVALVFRTLDALRVFDIFQILLKGQKYSMATYNYFQLIQAQDMGMASAIGVIIFLIIFIFALIYIRALGGVEE